MDSVEAKPVPTRVPGTRASGLRVQGHSGSREDALSTQGLINDPWLNGREPWAAGPIGDQCCHERPWLLNCSPCIEKPGFEI